MSVSRPYRTILEAEMVNTHGTPCGSRGSDNSCGSDGLFPKKSGRT